MNLFKKIPIYFSSPLAQLDKVLFFRKILYVFLFLNALTLLPVVSDLFHYYGLVGTRGWNTDIPLLKQGTKLFINVLSHPSNSIYPWVSWFFVIGQLVFLLLGIFNIWSRLTAVAIYIFTVNLFSKGYLAFTGGEVLVNILLFYLMFIHKPRDDGWFGDLQHILNKTFYWIILLQICLLYVMSAWYKLYDEDWLSGHAVQYISSLHVFKSPLTRFFEDSYALSAIATYTSLLYQILFPLVVWFKRIKIPFLIVGVFFHLSIAIGMGVFTFGIVMILVYILFLDDHHIEKLKSVLRMKKRPIQNA